MQRTCENPSCQRVFPELVPDYFEIPYIGLCGYCQYQIIKLAREHPDGFLAEKYLLFTLYHSKGCYIPELIDLLDMTPQQIAFTFEKGVIERTPIVGSIYRYWIPFDQMVIAIELHREWIPIAEVEEDSDKRKKLYKYANRGKFGLIQRNLSNLKSIHRSYLPEIDRILREIDCENQKNRPTRRWCHTVIEEDEMTKGMVATILQITTEAVDNLLETYLTWRREKGSNRKVVKKDHFIIFAIKAVSGEYRLLRASTVSQLKHFLIQEGILAA